MKARVPCAGGSFLTAMTPSIFAMDLLRARQGVSLVPQRDAHDRRRRETGAEVLGRIGRDELPAVDDDDTVADLAHLGEDMARENHGLFAAEIPDELPDLDDLLRVEAEGRLIEDENLGIVQYRLGDAHALLVPLRELADRPAGDLLQVRIARWPGRPRRAAPRAFTPLTCATKSRYPRTVISP